MSKVVKVVNFKMSILTCFLCSCITLLTFFGVGLGQEGQFPCHVTSLPTITVDPSGHGNFTTIQSAIDHVPIDNKNWLCISVQAGTYREKINIPNNKPFIYLRGDGKAKTEVVWNEHQSIQQTPTFTSSADNIVVESMAFINSYNSPGGVNKNPRVPAVAAYIAGDKTAFYGCTFSGLQDTLWDDRGRHYFSECTIKGAVDFIFGGGQSIYEGCVIKVLGAQIEGGFPGFITAQGRVGPDDPNGYVFKNCVVSGTGSTYLGRPWRDHARVIFYKTSLAGIIEPEGWNAGNRAGHEDQLTFVEYGCSGPGSHTTQRVTWEKKMSLEEVQQFTSIQFIDQEGWVRSQPSRINLGFCGV